MGALDDAIAWKLNFITEVRPLMRKEVDDEKDPREKRHKEARLKELEQEEKDLKGKDRKKAWDIAKANLGRWIRAAKDNLYWTTDPDARKSWQKDIDERESLLKGLDKEGRPK